MPAIPTSLFVLTAGLLLLAAGGKKVPTLLHQTPSHSTTLNPTPNPLRSASEPFSAPRAEAVPTPYRRPYANEQHNSRLTSAIPPVGFKVRAQFPLHETLPPSFVLQDGDRILVQAPEFRLFPARGPLISADRLSAGGAVMDAPNKLFYFVNPAGFVAARNLSDGVQIFNFLPTFGDGFFRIFLSRNGTRMVVAGCERMRDPHGEKVPTKSLIEIFDIGANPSADEMGYLTDLALHASLTIPSPELKLAAAAGRFVAATPGFLYLLDGNLKPTQTIAADFEPLSLSLDEAGRIFMPVLHNGKPQLWMFSNTGDLHYTANLTPGTKPLHPPVIGYDHTAYVLSQSQILAISPNGKLKWSRTAQASIAGAVIDTKDQLLVTEGATVVTYNAAGERAIVAELPETLVTPAILGENGDLLVASATRLFVLERLAW